MRSRAADAAAAHLLTIGDELLSGDTIDGNRAFLAERARRLGIEVVRAVSVGDRLEDIAAAVRQAVADVEVCLVSGGLGPTSDDVTAMAIAHAAGSELQCDAQALADIEAKFRAFGRPMADANRKQADLPVGAERLDNPIGTAPGFALDIDGCLVCCMPGVPRELRKMMIEQVEPRLSVRFPTVVKARRTYRILGIGESALAERIEPVIARARSRSAGLAAVFVHYRASYPEVLVVLEGMPAPSGQRASVDELASLDGDIRGATGPALYGIGEADLATRVVSALAHSGLHVALAESCTAGGAAALLGAVPGASACLLGGVVAYDNRIKIAALGVPGDLLAAHGAVSDEVAQAMADGARHAMGSDLAVAITGVAGPSGGTAEKPVGTVYIAISDAQGTTSRRLTLLGNRGTVQLAASKWAVKLVWDRLVERNLARLEELD